MLLLLWFLRLLERQLHGKVLDTWPILPLILLNIHSLARLKCSHESVGAPISPLCITLKPAYFRHQNMRGKYEKLLDPSLQKHLESQRTRCVSFLPQPLGASGKAVSKLKAHPCLNSSSKLQETKCNRVIVFLKCRTYLAK
jgi:hypothetical protein